jgi:hypothetical protein
MYMPTPHMLMLLIIFYGRSLPIGINEVDPPHPFWECSLTDLKPPAAKAAW